MAYIGNIPAESYSAFQKQDFTTSATTSYTLDHPVANQNELALFINFVRQEPTAAYTASGTSLTLTSATSVGDDMYCVYLGKAVQTVVPPSGSVGAAQLNYPLTTFSSTGIDDNATSTAITIDSSEKVGIGTSSPTTKLHLDIATDNTGILVNSTDATTGIALADNGGSAVVQTTSSGAFRVLVGGDASTTGDNSSERMRITSAGKFGMNGQTNPQYTMEFGDSGSGNGWSLNAENNVHKIRSRASASDTQTHVAYENTNGTVGTIKTNASATQYNTSSDYRLKENVSYNFDATTRLKELKPARFNFIADADTTVDGFIAHEVSSVVPEAISGEKDAVNEDGSINPQGIDQSKLVPLLVKTIQELEARITTLENA